LQIEHVQFQKHGKYDYTAVAMHGGQLANELVSCASTLMASPMSTSAWPLAYTSALSQLLDGMHSSTNNDTFGGKATLCHACALNFAAQDSTHKFTPPSRAACMMAATSLTPIWLPKLTHAPYDSADTCGAGLAKASTWI
jgi:hypothetical protein